MSKQQFQLSLLLSLVLLFTIACGGGAAEPTEAPIAVATLTPRPTNTPIPTRTPVPESNDSEDEGGSVLGGIVSDVEEEDEGNQSAEEVVEQPTETPTPEPIELLDPVEVSINLQDGELNNWIEIVPPPGWRIVQGIDGVVITQNPDDVINNPFVMVRRWGNVVNLTDFVAYLPNSVEEPDSNVAFAMGGYDWEGIFISDESNSYRALFGVSQDVLPSYTVLVYVPVTDPADPEAGASAEELLEAWELNVGDLNSILRRLGFY